jgi:hypothetical protein
LDLVGWLVGWFVRNETDAHTERKNTRVTQQRCLFTDKFCAVLRAAKSFGFFAPVLPVDGQSCG